MTHIIAIILIMIAFVFFSVVFDSYMKTNKSSMEIIYKIIIIVLLISTFLFAEDHHMSSILIAFLSLTFIEKIKMVNKEWMEWKLKKLERSQ